MKARYPLERLIFAAAIGADPQTKLANRRDTRSRIDVGANDAWTTLAKRCEDFNVPDVTEK